MANDAKVVILGNLAGDPKMNNVNGTTVVSFQVFVNTTKKEGDKYISDVYNVAVWGKAGEFIFPRLQKGTQVQCTGVQQMQSWKDKNGADRITPSVRADDVRPLARLKEAPKRDNNTDNGDDPF